jgi:hypothetical protein
MATNLGSEPASYHSVAKLSGGTAPAGIENGENQASNER